LIRSRILEQLGLARVVRLDRGGSHKLARAIIGGLRDGAPAPDAWNAVDLGGAPRVAEELVGAGFGHQALARAMR
jgi:hypothetical protein